MINLSFTPEEQYIHDELVRYYPDADPDRMRTMISDFQNHCFIHSLDPMNYQYNEFSEVDENGITRHQIKWVKKTT